MLTVDSNLCRSTNCYSHELLEYATIQGMDVVLTIVIGVLLLAISALGWRRGLDSGLLALIGTLLGAALVDLWYSTLGNWFRGWFPEHSDMPVWIVASVVFLLVSLIVGYGSSLLLFKQPVAIFVGYGSVRPLPNQPDEDDFPEPDIRDRVMGGLLGLLNGALIVSYLLRYTTVILNDERFNIIIQTSLVARLLLQWLPWFMLTVVLVVSVAVLLRLIIRFVYTRRANPADAISGSQSETEQDQAVLRKISQRLPE